MDSFSCRSVGAAVELLSPPQLKEKFPWLNTDGLALGCHGELAGPPPPAHQYLNSLRLSETILLIPSGVRNEGWFDPWSLLSAFRKKSISMGVHYLHGELETIGTEENGVKNVEVSVSLCHTHDFMRSSDSQTVSRPSFPHAAYWKQSPFPTLPTGRCAGLARLAKICILYPMKVFR